MAKRFTDTDIWDKEWFMFLSAAEKCAIKYIYDKCDCIGVWNPNFPLANFYIKEEISWKELPTKCNNNIEILKNGKWFIVDFIYFQYGILTQNCPPHRKYISELKKHGLFERVSKGFQKGIETLQEKEKEKEKEKEEERKRIVKEKPKNENAKFTPPTLEEVKNHIKENPELNNVNPEAFWKGFSESGWIDTRGNAVKNWKLKLRTWSNMGQKNPDIKQKTKFELSMERIKNDGQISS